MWASKRDVGGQDDSYAHGDREISGSPGYRRKSRTHPRGLQRQAQASLPTGTLSRIGALNNPSDSAMTLPIFRKGVYVRLGVPAVCPRSQRVKARRPKNLGRLCSRKLLLIPAKNV